MLQAKRSFLYSTCCQLALSVQPWLNSPVQARTAQLVAVATAEHSNNIIEQLEKEVNIGLFQFPLGGWASNGCPGGWAERVGEKASWSATATGLCDMSLQVAHGMLLQRHTKVVLALCLLLWQYFRALTDGIGPVCWVPFFLHTPTAHCTTPTNSSAWFNARYQAGTGPLLRGADYKLSWDVVQWWLVSEAMGRSLLVFPGSLNVFTVGVGPRTDMMGTEGCRDPSSILPPLHTLSPGLFCTLFLISHLFFLSFPTSLLGEMGLRLPLGYWWRC